MDKQDNKNNTAGGQSALSGLVMPNKEPTATTIALGLLLSVSTFMAFFFIGYGALFERKTYFNRQALWRWLKNNKLPEPKIFCGYKIWKIGELEITHSGNKWYAFVKTDCVICSFTGGLFDAYRYHRIKRMLEA